MNAPECKDIMNLIPLYIDDLLDEKESTAVKEHINQCQSCKRECEFMMSVMTKTKELPRVTAPCDFAARVVAKAKLKRTSRLLRRISSGVAAAAVLVLCVVNFDVLNSEEQPKENKRIIQEKTVTADKPDEAAESFTPAFFSEVERRTIITVEITEENAKILKELTKDYQEDSFGFIVFDMNILLKKLKDGGIEFTTEETTDITNDYIVIKGVAG